MIFAFCLCQVCQDEPPDSMKQTNEEGEREEDPPHCTIKLEESETVQEDPEDNPQVQRCLFL